MTNVELLRSLAKEASLMKNCSEENIEKAPVKKPTVSFVLTLAEYPDFIVTKTSPRSTKHLVVMPSAKAVFIKTDEKGEETSELLTCENYTAFSAGMPDISLPDGFWGKKVQKGKAFATRLLEIFENDFLLDGICKKAFPESEDFLEAQKSSYAAKPETKYEDAYRLYPKLLIEYNGKAKAYELLMRETVFCKDLIDTFGLENMRDFLDSYMESLMQLRNPNGYYRDSPNRYVIGGSSLRQFEDGYRKGDYRARSVSIRPHVTMKYATFRDYVLHSSVRMGYALIGRDFFEEWRDTLSMQWEVYGKLTDKYPADLPLLHKQLSYKMDCMRTRIDERKFALQSEKAREYEGKYKDYVFIAPHCKQDFYDEATSQSNCLAGYVGSFTEGHCLILFMRKKNDPEKSYITVEIVDGEVRQAKLAMNKNPGIADMGILHEWIEKCNKKIESEESEIVA